MKRALASGMALTALLLPARASADDYDAGALIIPMDTTYQDVGMLKAYGLVYALLRQGVPVDWAIRQGKQFGEQDFVADATDYQSGDVITAHGYRGGPWIIDSAHAAAAKPVIDAWQASNTTAVHVATNAFSSPIARHLIIAPTIAMFADGNEDIARGYVKAAGIPDSTLDSTWPATSPDLLTIDEIAGPTDINHADGALFDANGAPVYCQIMSMHWNVTAARANPEVVAEVRSFLGHPTHFFAECQAVNAYENDPVSGLFLTTAGFEITEKPTAVDFYNASSPFAQMDGAFAPAGGSEPSYTLPAGGLYKTNGITMITKAGTPEGDRDVWMTGFLDGICPPDTMNCGTIGKVSYLGGHQYDTKTPMSTHPATQGTRLFLNSLFEAQCATAAALPTVTLTKAAPAFTSDQQVTFTIDFDNGGPGVALDFVLHDSIPAGSSFVSATQNGTFANGEVTWNLGNLPAQAHGVVSFVVTLPDYGTYQNTAQADYRVGMNTLTETSNTTSTVYDTSAGGTGGGGAGGTSGAAGSAGAAGVGGSTGTGGDGGAGAQAGAGGVGGTPGGSGGTGDSDAIAGAGGTAQSGGAGGTAGNSSANPGGQATSGDSGGCGCSVVGDGSTARGIALLAALAAVGSTRRRRSSKRRSS